MLLNRNRICLLIYSLLLCLSCGKDRNDDLIDIPSCLLPTYDEFIFTQEDCVGAKVVSYAFQDEEVFAMVEGDCTSDTGITIYSQECVEMCYLFALPGAEECNGVVFFDEAVLVRIIWES